MLSLSLASAAVDITNGSISFEADYADFNDGDDTLAETATFTVENTGSSDITVRTTVSGLPAGYSTETISDVPVIAGSSASVTFTVNVPHEHGSGAAAIGTIRVEDINSSDSDTASLVQNTRSMIVIDKLTVDYIDEDNDDASDSFDDGDEQYELDKDVLVGTTVVLTFELKNLFDDPDYDDGELNDLQLTLEPSDDDLFEDDFEEEYDDFSRLSPREEESLTVEFKISEEADTGSYSFDITLEAEDDTGATHTFERELSLSVHRERDDVRITELNLKPHPVSACNARFTLDVELHNFGTREQKHAALSIFNDALDIDENVVDIVLEEFDDDDTTWSKTYTYDLGDDLDEGTYRIDVTAYIDQDEVDDEQVFNLAVEKCTAESSRSSGSSALEEDHEVEDEDTEEAAEENITVRSGAAASPERKSPTSSQQISSATIVETTEQPYTQEDLLVALIVVVIVLIAAMIALFVAVLLKR